MTDIAKIAKTVSDRTEIDRQLVEDICKFSFLFVTDVMKDEQDTHDILFNKLFKFKLKTRYKQNKTNPYAKQ